MSDDNNKISFLLDLDVSEFTEKGLAAKGVIEQLGHAEGMTELLESLKSVAPILGAAGIAAFAFKEALDFTLEGEEIRRINDQFNSLSVNAGVAPEKLKKGLEEAASGLIDTDQLLKLANESIVKLGGGAERLPEIMEIAKKATQVYGGTAEQVFQNITNAIATGRTQTLKQYGIQIDMNKAVEDFAKAQGLAVNQLSQAAKNQAVLNAALQSGAEAFKNVKYDGNEAVNTLQTIKVAFGEIQQVFIMAFENTVGPGMRTFLTGVKDAATQANLYLTDWFGKGAEQASAKTELLKQKLTSLNQEMNVLEKGGGNGFFSKLFNGNPEKRIEALKLQITATQGELNGLTQQQAQSEKDDEARNEKAIQAAKQRQQEELIDQAKKKAAEQAFQKELDTIDKQALKLQEDNINKYEDIDKLSKLEEEQSERQHQSALQAIRNNKNFDPIQKKKLEAAEFKRYEEQKTKDEAAQEQNRSKLLDNWVKNSEKSFQGVERAFKANTEKMKMEQADFGKRGTEMFNALSANANSAFTQMGADMVNTGNIGQSVANAMKGFFLGFLGDRAIAEGNLMLLSGIWPPNPVAIAGGTALLALGGALKALAGSSGAPSTAINAPSAQSIASGSAPPLAPISGGTDSAGASDNSMATPSMDTQAVNQRTVQVNIAGNYLETDQTRRMLMDLMRQESDATGFSYNQIGA